MKSFKHNEHAGRTAIRRNKMSAPTRWLMEEGYLGEPVYKKPILDFGCGKGDDVRGLKAEGYDVFGYDPNHEPFKQEPPHYNYNIVLCNYVLNVTMDDEEMKDVMFAAYARLKEGGVAYFTVRRDIRKEGVQRTGAYQRLVYPEKITNECRSIEYKGNAYEIYAMHRPYFRQTV